MVQAWAKLIWNSIGVAVVAAAAQLAVAQALGIVRWSDAYQGANVTGWSALLTWIAFIYAVSVLGGAAVGRRAVRRPTRPDTVPARVAAALSAGVGAVIAIAIALLPAIAAKPPINVHPELVVGVTAGAGVIAGIVVTLCALSIPPVAGAVRAAVAWIWFLGIGSALAGYLTHRAYASPRLAVLDAPSIIPVAWWSGPYAMIGFAAILGAGVAAVARWGDAHRFGIAVSGLAGPVVVAAAYLIAGPGTGANRGHQLDPYNASLIAILVGVAASVAVALPGGRTRTSTAPSMPSAPAPAQRPALRHPEQPYPEPQPQLAESYNETENYNETRSYSETQSHDETGHHDTTAYPAAAEPYEPLAAPSDPHPTAERPVVRVKAKAKVTPAPPMMGQPPRSYEEDYSDWLRDLGHAPSEHA